MHLKTLLAGLSLRSATADMETEITHISYDSRTTAPGDVFVAMTGFATDGHAYIGKAVAAGAAAVVCERPPEDSSVPYVLVENSRRALAVMAANYYGHPADSMTMVAVTGTNGKTTTTYLLKAILEQELGAKVGLIGTNQDLIGDEVVPTERTTPESLELQELFAPGSWYAQACTSYYEAAEAVNLRRLFYDGIGYAGLIYGQCYVTDRERDWVLEQKPAAENYGIFRAPRAAMDDVLRQYFDISLDDTRKMGLDSLLYWEEADAWYATHTDTGLNTVTLTGGERTDDGLLKLYYSGGYITLRPTQDGQSPQPYFIVSNQPES